MRSAGDVMDVVIVGSGAGGSPLALRLSQAGMRVLVLEKGPRHARGAYRHDEMLKVTQPDFFVPLLEQDPHVLVDHTTASEEPELTTLGWIASCVGGGTARMGGSCFRFHPDDFRLRSRLGDFEAVVDWPYSYEDLEPYYCQAEWEIGVSGASADNPFQGFRSRSYPMPPLEPNALCSWFDQACGQLGLHPHPTPRAINSRPYRGRPACAYCDFCAGYGCPTGARGSMDAALLPRAELTGRCEIRPGAMVREIVVSREGRATGCIYLDGTGAEHRIRARIVCVCCSAVESARLLLMSTSPAFPNGLGNGSGLVGRNLQFHVGSAGRARFRYDRHPDKLLADRNAFLGRSVMDYYFLPDGVSDVPKGGILKFRMGRVHPIGNAQAVAFRGSRRPLWGAPLKRAIRERLRENREVCFEVFQDFIPNARTCVGLDPDVVDRWGLPVARIHLDHPDHHRRTAHWLVERGLEILGAMGADEVMPRDIGYTSRVMAHGTCRAGSDPVNSVLNGFCRAHEVPNLFVVDGSFMPTSGAAPSTLSIVANSFRTADYIVDRARTGELGM